jgi:hypothetical protein
LVLFTLVAVAGAEPLDNLLEQVVMVVVVREVLLLLVKQVARLELQTQVEVEVVKAMDLVEVVLAVLAALES